MTSKEEILDLACELGKTNSQVHWRAGIGRAYYAAYHGCDVWHDARVLPGSNIGPSGGMHQQLINKLANPAPECIKEDKLRSKQLSIQLNVLRTSRTIADYHLHTGVDSIAHQNACATAKLIFEKLA